MVGAGRARLVVLAAEVGGRWSQETVKLPNYLAAEKARSAPRASCMAPSLGQFVGLDRRTQFCPVLAGPQVGA